MKSLFVFTIQLTSCICLLFGIAKAQTEIPLTYSPDGAVTSMITKGDTLIVGGNFNHVGKYTGGGALFSNISDQPDLSFPKFNGTVTCSTPDGNGGFYVLGNYYRETENPSSGSPRIEHILANNTFDIGFSIPITGVWNTINHILFHNGILYLGAANDYGILGQPAPRLAAINVTTKQLISWIPALTRTAGNIEVTRIAANGNSLYILGGFTEVGGVARVNAASIQIGTGAVNAWNPTNNWNNGFFNGYSDLLFYNNSIIIGGAFGTVGLPTDHAAAMVDNSSGQLIKYLFKSGGLFGNNSTYLYFAAGVNSLAIKGDVLFTYTTGTFDTRVTAVNLLADAPFNVLWMKYFNMIASPSDMAVIGNSLFLLGSNFNEVYKTDSTNASPTAIERKIKGGVKLNTTTGALENWYPDPVGWNVNDVRTMSVSGTKVFAGGVFSHVNGLDRVGVYMMNTQTETILPFKLNFGFGYPYTSVRALKLVGDNLYVGGGLNWLTFRDDYSVLSFNVNTGSILNWYPPKLGVVEAMEVNDEHIFVGGTLYEPTGGAGRQHLFAINRNNATLNSWASNPSQKVNTLHLANGQLYVGGDFTTISGQTRNRAASYNVNNLSLTNWNPDVSWGGVNAIQLKSGSVWLGGGFSSVGGLNRNLIAGVDPITGSNNINPSTSFFGWPVNTFASKACKVFVGGGFARDNTNTCNGLSIFDLSTNTLVPTSSFCLKVDGHPAQIYSSAMAAGDDLFLGGGFGKINSNTKNINIGRVRFPANYFAPCTILNCNSAVALSSTVDDYSTGQYQHKTNSVISATNKVTGTAQVNLKSNSSVLLLPNANNGKGFMANPSAGGVFKAEIGGCN